MNRDCRVTAALKRQQITMFREARELGITAKIIHYDTGGDNGGISESAIGQWARGETLMGLDMLNRMIGIIPDDLLSMLLPEGRAIVQLPENIDHDEVATWAEAYATRKLEAHRADSPMGPAIAPCEDDDLKGLVVRFPGRAAA